MDVSIDRYFVAPVLQIFWQLAQIVCGISQN